MQSFLKLLCFFLPFYFVTNTFLISCANIVPPSGGPKDSLPPKLVSALPNDSASNFNSKKIILTFDEYIDVKDIQQNLLVSPYPNKMPQIDFQLHKISIKLKDSLEQNTTYKIDFGDAIRDINEGNILHGFKYIFSTNNKIDDGLINGKVILAENGNVDSTLIVILHNNLSDSAVLKLPPRYVSKINGKGTFQFSNLPYGEYNIFVVPNDYTKRYDDSLKQFGFLLNSLKVSKKSDSNNLSIYAYQQSKLLPKTETTKPNPKRLTISNELGNQKKDIFQKLIKFTSNNPLIQIDTNKILLLDSNNVVLNGYKLDTTKYNTYINFKYDWSAETTYKIVFLKTAFKDTFGNNLKSNDTIKFTTKSYEDYGSIKIEFEKTNLKNNPVLELFDKDVIVFSQKITSRILNIPYFNPGIYDIKILFDNNNNGVWDPGNYSEKKLPEITHKIEKTLTVKPNTENSLTITIN